MTRQTQTAAAIIRRANTIALAKSKADQGRLRDDARAAIIDEFDKAFAVLRNNDTTFDKSLDAAVRAVQNAITITAREKAQRYAEVVTFDSKLIARFVAAYEELHAKSNWTRSGDKEE